VSYAAEDGKIAKALIVKNLAISLPIVGGGDRLIITAAGCRALLTRRSGTASTSAAAALAAADSDQPSGQAEAIAATKQGEMQTSEAAAPEQTAGSTSAPTENRGPKGKLGALIDLLQRPEGASVEDMMTATGWQSHSVRGALSGALKKKHRMAIVSERTDAGRVYRIPATQ
jgi:hypothetical protein